MRYHFVLIRLANINLATLRLYYVDNHKHNEVFHTINKKIKVPKFYVLLLSIVT